MKQESVVINIENSTLILTTKNTIKGGHARVGSISVDRKNGERQYIRCFGHVDPHTDPKAANQFEIQLRKICEDPSVFALVFGEYEDVPRTRWFNPSLELRARGWGTEPLPAYRN